MARSKVVRFGVIGIGSMGQGHCASIDKAPEARLAAVCDTDAATAEKVADHHQVAAFTRYRDLIRSDLCDAVIVATPHPLRPPIAIDCMKAGLHLLSEKPLAETVSAADRMIRTARRTGVAFGVMFQRRTEPVLAKAIEIARGGRLGALSRATLIFPDYRSQAYYDAGGWRATWRGEGGGVLLNQAPHILDVFLQMTGTPRSVLGRAATRLHRIEVEDTAEAMLTYAGGATGYLYCTTNDVQPGEMIEIAGDKGKLIYRDGELRLLSFRPAIRKFTQDSSKMWGGPAVRETSPQSPPRPTGHQAVIRNFCRHVLHGTALIAPGEDGLASLELANAVYLSSFKGEEVRLPICRKEYDTFLDTMRRRSKGRKTTRSVRRETDPRHM